MGMTNRVAVLLTGYGEVEHYDEFADYNERSYRLLVSKSIKFPDFSIPFLSRRLERAQKKEWHAANHYHSPHNDIFERQRAGIAKHLGVKLEVNVPANWGDLIPMLRKGQGDLIGAGMGVSDERSELIAFAQPYALTHTRIVWGKGHKKIDNAEELSGKRIHVRLQQTNRIRISRHVSC